MAWATFTFNQAGGSGGQTGTLYYETSGHYWATAKSSSSSYRVTSISRPTKAGFVFASYAVVNEYGVSVPICNSAGYLLVAYGISAKSYTAQAVWLDYVEVSINAGGGVGGTDAVYKPAGGEGVYADSALTTPISSVALPTRFGYACTGLFNGADAFTDADGVLTDYARGPFAANFTVTAAWTSDFRTFGRVYDFFGIASDALVPFASSSGDTSKRVSAYNLSVYEPGVVVQGGKWRNPSVSYRVTKDTTLSITLGKAFPGYASPIVSGYMITGVKVSTSVGEFPVVTVEGTANEGVDAVKTVPVSIAISANAHAQELDGCMGAGFVGLIQSCELSIECTPVVVEENLMPCASDITAPVATVSATVSTPANEGEPTGGNGYSVVSCNNAGSDEDFTSYIVSMVKELQ